MGREVVQLVTEIVTEQVAAASRKMEADYRASVAGMDRATKGTQAQVDKLGSSMTNAGRLAMGAGKALSAGIGAATAAAAGAERSWVALGTSILSTFAAGGPIAGGIAIVAAGVGLLAGESKKAAAAAGEARAAQAKWLDETKAKAAAAAAEIQKMRDAIDAARRSRLSGSDVDPETIGMERDLGAARMAVAAADRAARAAEAARQAYLARGASSEVVEDGGLFGEDVTRATKARRVFGPEIQAAENARAAAAAKVAELEAKLAISAAASEEAMMGQASAKERTAKAAALAAVREAEAAAIAKASAAASSAGDRLRELQFRGGLSAGDRPFGSEMFAVASVEAEIAKVRAAADRLRAQQESLRQAAALTSETGLLGAFTRGGLESGNRSGLAGRLGVDPSGVEAEIQKRLQAYASEDSALRRQLEALTAILGLTRETAAEEVKRAGALGTVALGRETEALALGNRFRGQTGPVALDIARMQGQASAATDPAMRAAIEARIQARTAELAVLEAQRAKAEAILALEVRLAELRDPKKGIDPAAVASFERESRASIEAAYAQTVALSTARGVAQAAPAVEDSMRGLLTTIQGTLGQGLTDILMDGITNGFRNGEQIALGIVRSMLAQVLNSIVASGIQAAFGGLFGGGGGAAGILGGLVGGGGGGAPVGLANLVPAAVGAAGCSGGT